jgi:hypothetical protein
VDIFFFYSPILPPCPATITHRTRSTCTSSSGAAGRFNFSRQTSRAPLPRKLTFTDPEKIRELARRGEAWGTSEARQVLEHAIDVSVLGCRRPRRTDANSAGIASADSSVTGSRGRRWPVDDGTVKCSRVCNRGNAGGERDGNCRNGVFVPSIPGARCTAS